MSDQNPSRRRKIAGERKGRGQPTKEVVPEPPPRPQEPRPREPRPERSEPAEATNLFGGGGVPSWLLVGLAVLLAAAVVFDVIIGVRSRTASEERTTSTAAVTSALREAPVQAETAAVRALAFDYKTLQDDADEAKSYMTSDYAAQFQKTVDDLLAAPANQREAHVEADVKASGVVNATASTVDVMLFVDQTSQTTLQSEPQTYLNRVVFTMVKSGDQWLVDDVTAL
jgi:Mce-associated membrane protein